MRLQFDWSVSSNEVKSAIDNRAERLNGPNSEKIDGVIDVKNTDPSSLRDMAMVLESAAKELEQEGY